MGHGLTATLAEIMDALADQIRDAMEDVTDLDVQVEPRMYVQPDPTCIDMYPTDPSNDPDLRAFSQLHGGELITVRARFSTADHDSGQDLLLALMDDTDELSLEQAVHSRPDAWRARVRPGLPGAFGYITFIDSASDAALLGATWTVVVIKARS